MTARGALRLALYHDLPSGGAKRMLVEQVRRLRARGHRVDAFVPATADETFLPLAPHVDNLTILPRIAPPNREAMLRGRPSFGDLARWAAVFHDTRATDRRAAAAIDSGGYDLVLVHGSQWTQAPWLLRYLRTRSLYMCQEPLRAAHERGVVGPLLRVVLRQTLGRIDRVNCRAATVVAANSRYSAGRVEAIYGRPAHVIYPAVDAARFHPERGGAGDVLLTVGALHPLKGHDFLIRAIGDVPPENRLPLVIIADRARDREAARLQDLASRSGVALEVRYRVPDEELVTWYARARLVLYAAHREPFGLVPLEAMACGRPVLAVAEGGMLETIVDGRTGFHAPRDEPAFAWRILELLSDPNRCQAVARAGLRAAREQWTWERSVDAFEDLCHVAVGRSSSRYSLHAQYPAGAAGGLARARATP
jgi:glycosyltransferase involved in cell wall biosynthesis